ncbi:MAG: aminopeptidase P family N-terminal domain-containing protein, partial [Gaiellaceae bacterium]
MQLATGIPSAELQARREKLLQQVRSLNLTGYVLFGEDYIQYFTSFGFLATERPVALVANASGDVAIFVPEFEVERVRDETEFERVESYTEYPGAEHPMSILAR